MSTDLEKLENGTKLIKEWIKTQPQLPQNMKDILLHRFVHSVHFDFEKIKKLIIHNLEIRNKSKELFFERDPLAPEIQAVFDVVGFYPLPILTKDDYKVVLLRLDDADPNKYDYVNVIKLFFMFCDIYLIKPEPTTANHISEGDILVHDLAGLKFKHLTRTIISVMQVAMKYAQEAHPIRLKQIHLINCPQFIDHLMKLVKPFMKKEVKELMHFHADMESFYKHIPLELLPTEYGGKSCNMPDMKKSWKQFFIDYRDYLMDSSSWLIKDFDEKNNNNEKDNNKVLNESFRQISFD